MTPTAVKMIKESYHPEKKVGSNCSKSGLLPQQGFLPANTFGMTMMHFAARG